MKNYSDWPPPPAHFVCFRVIFDPKFFYVEEMSGDMNIYEQTSSYRHLVFYSQSISHLQLEPEVMSLQQVPQEGAKAQLVFLFFGLFFNSVQNREDVWNIQLEA